MPAVSRMYSDSGVVTRMCGGLRSIAARSLGSVSPVRTRRADPHREIAALQRELLDLPQRTFEVLLDVVRQRLERRYVHYLRRRGQRALDRLPQEAVDAHQKRGQRLPRPVGAEISVGLPARMLGHPYSCGSVGVPNFVTNHSAVTG